MGQMSALEVMDRFGSTGPDFLTWLAVHVRNEDLPKPPSEPGLEVDISGPLLLTSDTGEATKVTLAGDEAALSPEFVAALHAGKRLRRAKLEFKAQDAVWKFTLDAETFDLKSVALPVPKMPDLDEYMTMRVQALQHLGHVLDELFELFLAQRLDVEKWRDEVLSWAK